MSQYMARLVIIFLTMWIGLPSSSAAQEYILDRGDLINVTFWQQPDLNTQVRIDSEGKIDLPLIGRIPAAGLTIEQLSSEIVDRMSIYNKRITQASISIAEYGSKKIFITGAVAKPGKLTFARMPNIWEAILEAGGPLQTAQLSKVQLIRGGDQSGNIIEVDLTLAFESGEIRDLPKLKPGDNIHVPAATAVAGQGLAKPGQAQPVVVPKDEAIYVFGHVLTPGVYPFEEGMDVLQAIIHAGGPELMRVGAGANRPTLEADLKRVKIITKGPDAPVVYSVDIEKYTNQATPIPLRLKPGDTIFIPGKQVYSRFFLTTTLTEIIKGSVTVITTYLVLNELLGQNDN